MGINPYPSELSYATNAPVSVSYCSDKNSVTQEKLICLWEYLVSGPVPSVCMQYMDETPECNLTPRSEKIETNAAVR